MFRLDNMVDMPHPLGILVVENRPVKPNPASSTTLPYSGTNNSSRSNRKKTEENADKIDH